MAQSEARKKASAKYHREHIASLACRVRKEEAEQFRAYCESIGKTPNSVLKEYVLQCIGNGESREREEVPNSVTLEAMEGTANGTDMHGPFYSVSDLMEDLNA